jgi:predicted small integral membrane protein
MAQPLSETRPQEIPQLDPPADDTNKPARIYEVLETTDVAHQADRQGFLPFATNTFDRCFISVLCFVAISLLWMRFLEPYLFPNNIWLAVALSIIWAVFLVRRG